jgi:plastocyanin
MKKLLLLPLFVLALGAASPAGADDYAVSIMPSGFPPLITIQNGDRVVWKNNDHVNRQVVADDNTWKSPVLKPGQTWARLFVNGGTFTYHGAVKPNQHGRIVVDTSRVVLIRQTVDAVQLFRSVQLQGSVSKSGATGEEVSIEARPFGNSTFTQVTRTTTKNGVWRVLVKPRRNTVYRAVWENVPSAERIIHVKPVVRLRQLNRRLFTVGVLADTTLVHRWVVIQRLNKGNHTWHSFKSIRLTRFTSTARSYTSLASFHATYPHGMVIRALIAKRQALPLMYGAAWSRALRV